MSEDPVMAELMVANAKIMRLERDLAEARAELEREQRAHDVHHKVGGEANTYALRPTTFAPGRRVPGRT
jgi:hypothetical protein